MSVNGEGRSEACEQCDVTEDMKRVVDKLALSNHLPPSQIWNTVRKQFYGDSNTNVVTSGLSDMQVKKRVYRVRQEVNGVEVFGRLEVPPLSRVPDENGTPTRINFHLFHFAYYDPSDEKRHRVLGWGHPVLLKLLKQNKSSVFVDGTFRCVPSKFKQCIVLTAFDKATGGYYPAAFVLATSNKYDIYFHAVQYAMDPEFVYCDFEAALHHAIHDHSPDVKVVGCLFHFKQSCRRRMKKYRIPEKECTIAMASGVLDMLTVIPRHKVPVQGVEWVKEKIRSQCVRQNIGHSTAKWEQFWSYFDRTWIKKFPPTYWNVEGFTDKIINRTNNPLERFSRELNAAIPTPHPDLPSFVSIIEMVARRYTNRHFDINHGNGRSTMPPRRLISIPTPISLPDLPKNDEEHRADESRSSSESEANIAVVGTSGAKSVIPRRVPISDRALPTQNSAASATRSMNKHTDESSGSEEENEDENEDHNEENTEIDFGFRF